MLLVKLYCRNGHFVGLRQSGERFPRICRICKSRALLRIEDSNPAFWSLEVKGLERILRPVKGAVNAKGKPIRAFRQIDIRVFEVFQPIIRKPQKGNVCG